MRLGQNKRAEKKRCIIEKGRKKKNQTERKKEQKELKRKRGKSCCFQSKVCEVFCGGCI